MSESVVLRRPFESADASACTCGSAACFLLHADHGCGGHPAFPAPSVSWRDIFDDSSGVTRRETAKVRALRPENARLCRLIVA